MKGKNMPNEDIAIQQFEHNRDMARYVRAQCDGGHGEDEEVVGIGLHIDFVFEVPHEATVWQPWLKADGKCKGMNACDAKVSPFTTMV